MYLQFIRQWLTILCMCRYGVVSKLHFDCVIHYVVIYLVYMCVKEKQQRSINLNSITSELLVYPTCVRQIVDSCPCWLIPNTIKNDICCFSATYASLRSNSKYWFTRNQNNVAELFQQVSAIKIIIFIPSDVTCPCHDIFAKLLIWR